jgi:4-amino-4-deoxy-L-arabinose transferase-like glycosyltransferase
MKRTSVDRVIGVALFVVTLALFIAGARTQGNTRDEGYYFSAAPSYSGWYTGLFQGKGFSRDAIDRAFSYNHEHPALMKTLFGLSWRAFGYAGPAKSHLLDEETAMRLPTLVLMALLSVVVFSFGARAWSRGAGLVAAVLTIASPRLFFDGQLACFDAPIAALWVFVVYGYYRSLTDPRWAWRTAVLFGLSLATKHNAFFIPFVLLAHYLYVHRRRLRALKLPPIPRVFIWMALLSPVVYLLCWPWLWFDTVARFREYMGFHVHHVHYNMEYLGTNYNKPPSPLSFPYVMTLFTTPVTTLALSLGGTVALIFGFFSKKKSAKDPTQQVPLGDTSSDTAQPSSRIPAGGISPHPGLLCGMNALFPLMILTVTRAPIFGGTKHWHAALPFLALLAGYAWYALVESLPKQKWIAPALAIMVCLPATVETVRAHPYALTHYNLLAGGPQGGADLGMNRQFWGYATRGLLPWLNRKAPPNTTVYFHDTNTAQQRMWQNIGVLRKDLRDPNVLEEPGVLASNIALVIHEKHFNKYEYWIWDFYGTAQPSQVLTHEGVPIVTAYERPSK